MRYFVLCILLLAPSSALAQVSGVCSPGKNCSFWKATITAASATPAITLANVGAKICLSPGCLNYINGSGNDFQIFGGAGSSYQIFSTGSGITISPSTGYTNFASGAISNLTASTPVRLEDTEGFRIQGVASASLSTCNAGQAGTLQYDTTNNVFRVCNGTGWRFTTPPLFTTNTTFWFNGSAALLNLPFGTSGSPQSAWGTRTSRITKFDVSTVGVGAGSMTISLYETGVGVTTNVCTIPCTTAAGTTITCGNTITAPSLTTDYEFRLTATGGCGTLPTGTITYTEFYQQ